MSVNKYTKGPFGKHVSIWGIYKYIHARWVKIVFDLFLRRTPGVTGTPRVWISAHVGYICDMRTAYRRTTTYIIYNNYPHRYKLRTYRDPHTTRCSTGTVCSKYVHRCYHHRFTYPILPYIARLTAAR